MEVWVDGVHVSLPYSQRVSWKQVSSFTIYPCNNLIAIRCFEHGGIAGILASGWRWRTDLTWRCTRRYQSGWNQPGFNTYTPAWGYAQQYGRNGVHPWGRRPGISTQAQWIWFGPNNGAHSYVYCRKKF